jgi:predicted alpha-1,2-mannosidase
MKKIVFILSFFFTTFNFCTAQTIIDNLCRYVDPFIGAEGGGNIFPGTALPFSMVRLGPDYGNKYKNSGWDDKGNIDGFSHTHVSGSGGGPKYGNILVMPVIGKIYLNDYSSPGSDEKAEVGLYSVKLDKYDVSVRLSSTHSAGLHEYTFPKSVAAHILIDAGSFLIKPRYHPESQQLVGSEVRIISDKEIEGYSRIRGGWNMGGAYTVYFYAMFDTPASHEGTWKSDKLAPGSKSEFDSGEKTGAWFTFKTYKGQKIKVKVGISFLSVGKAKENLKELTTWKIDQVQKDAENKWNDILDKVVINDNNEANKKIFYTAMYHAFLQPTNRAGENPKWHSDEPYYTIWDTFRATNPLFTLLNPALEGNLIRSLIDIYKFEGYMPDGRAGNDNGRVQGGTDADILIADAMVKKIDGIDYNKAFEAMLKDAEVPPGGDERKEGRGGLPDYNTLGFVSTKYERAGSRTIEYANNDYAISVVAKNLGKNDLFKKYRKRASNWQNLWNYNIESFGAKGFIWPRHDDKSWASVDSISTLKGGSWPDFFYESNSWEISFYVPQDVKTLIEKCGGKDAFESRLDTFFTHPVKNKDDNLGIFNVSNEPGFLTPVLYNYIDKQDKTAALVRNILAASYNTSSSGIPGNDDSGSMSAWYIFQALGFYPNTGQDVYLVSSPIFKDVVIHLENGKSLHVTAQNAGPENFYIQSASLNGKPLQKDWFRHTDIMNGGSLSFVMGSKPSGWASDGQLPPSMSDEK